MTFAAGAHRYGLFAAGAIDDRLYAVQSGPPHRVEKADVDLSDEQARAKFMCL
jgi:hypothetical protein